MLLSSLLIPPLAMIPTMMEAITENGSMVQTNLVFPGSIYNQLIIDGQPISGKVRELKSIW